MEGWVKSYRSVLDHELLANDNSAYIVFTKLLLKVDRKTGKYTTGRFKLGDLCNLKPITAWKALHRLKNGQMVSLSSNNRFTVITICNWTKYQGNGNSSRNNQVTTGEQPSNTKQEEEEEEEVYNPDVKEILPISKGYSARRGNSSRAIKPAGTTKQSFRRAQEIIQLLQDSTGSIFDAPFDTSIINKLLDAHGLEKVKRVLIHGLSIPKGEYSVTISSPQDLSRKWHKIIEHMDNPKPQDNKEGWT